MQNAVRVRDLFVITPLQLDELSFSDIIRLLKDEELPGRQWFYSEVEAKELAFSLKRMVEAGLVACYPDGEVGARAVPLPPLPLMEKYWFGLTPTGRERLQHPVPWDYPPHTWGFPSESSWLHSLVQAIRSEPTAWIITPIDARPSKAKNLVNCMSYKSELRKIGQNTRSLAHVIELQDSESEDLLHGHFLPPSEEPPKSTTADIDPTIYVDELVLDVISDDVENGLAILALLNHELTNYQKLRGSAAFSPEEVLDSLARLVSSGLAIPLKEDRGYLVVRTFSQGTDALEDLWVKRSGT